MSYDLTGRSLYPLSDIVSKENFPLADYIPLDKLNEIFSGIFYTESEFEFDGQNSIITARLAFKSISITPPGCNAFKISLGKSKVWTSVFATFVIGPDLSLTFEQIRIGIEISKDVLQDVKTKEGAYLSTTVDITVSPNGISLETSETLDLDPAYLAGTKIKVETSGARLVFGGRNLPSYLADQVGFEGITFDKLEVSIPEDYLKPSKNNKEDKPNLIAIFENAAIGTTGFTGNVSVKSKTLTGQFLGFDFKFNEFSLSIIENSILESHLSLDIRLKALEENEKKWARFDIFFGVDETPFSAALSPINPTSNKSLITANFEKIINIGISGARLVKHKSKWALYLSGNMKILIGGVDEWPRLEFDEFGISSSGDILLPEGSGIVFSSPLVVDWHFVRLTIPKLRFGRPKGEPKKFQIKLSGEVNILEGIPAASAVEGLSIEWEPGGSPKVDLEGLAVKFGVAGSFNAEVELGYKEDNGIVTFQGHGKLDLHSLDMKIEVGIMLGENKADPFKAYNFMYLFADAKILPTGIPIASTGLSIYGFQGLLAYNMRLDIAEPEEMIPADERYYEVFKRDPIGITDLSKWSPKEGSNAIGVGILLGTSDKGFAFNVKGLLVIAFPDITLFLQAKAKFLSKKSDLSKSSEGHLYTLLTYSTVDSSLVFDIGINWGMSDLFALRGSGRAFFSFSDSQAWYLQIGENETGKRLRAQAIRLNKKWLFSSGFWFKLDNKQGLVTGILVELELRASTGGFFVEVIGYAEANLHLHWENPQWEGSWKLFTHVRAGYRGISVGFSLGGDVKMQATDPLSIQVSARACFKALFWKVCIPFKFSWSNNDIPKLVSPIREWSVTPRHWTPIIKNKTLPIPTSTNGGTDLVELDTGRLELKKQIGTEPILNKNIPPNSKISLNFAKPMFDNTNQFNEFSNNGDGFIRIGNGANYSAKYEVKSVTLIRDPDGSPETIKLWGVWDKSTIEENTTLYLYSHERFGHDGSISESFPDDIRLDYCEPKTVENYKCVSLEDIELGYGELEDGSIYHWHIPENHLREREIDCVLLNNDSHFLDIYLPKDIQEIQLKAKSKVSKKPITVPIKVIKDRHARIVGIGKIKDKCLFEFCYLDPPPKPRIVGESRRGKIIHTDEYWTVDGELRLLEPNTTYRLEVTHKSVLKHGSSISSGASKTEISNFKTSLPQSFLGSLTNYIAATYPTHGGRPIYLGYDFIIRFKENYVSSLYTSARMPLVIRLIDSHGAIVLDEDGNEVIIPASRSGKIVKKVTEKIWEREVRRNIDRGCLESDEVKFDEPKVTVIGSPAPKNLLKNTQYTAELLAEKSKDKYTPPLFRWTFTTSKFNTFREMIGDPNKTIITKKPTDRYLIKDDNFNTSIRKLGEPTTAYINFFSITQFININTKHSTALLLEAPEPFETGLRLSVKIDNIAIHITPNLDQTRILLLPNDDNNLWQKADHEIELNWKRKPNSFDEDFRIETKLEKDPKGSGYKEVIKEGDEIITFTINGDNQ